MKYYKIKIKRRFEKEDKVLGHANGEFVPNGAFYFDRIGDGEVIEDTPIFDYFHLQSFGEEKDWEWRLQDVHGFIYVGSIITGWYISDKLKPLLEKFKIAPKYHFYETRLLYKGEKLKYWIFQFPINPLQNIIFGQSHFYYLKNDINTVIKIENESEFIKIRRKLMLEEDIELECSKVCFSREYDIIYNLPNGDTLCSEALKQAIEQNYIIGFEFSELDYEVVVG
ncbi:hypothetical protein [Capnocytophaga stomatis]|uniref:hypothetical protein n=1 Tax=Capnocytophaga stomatis TaxID=1848904 RepID=UPI00194F5081|nr:hypothetical protein [Capnocytophaga stomatis]